MFHYASSFNGNLSQWNVGKVTNMYVSSAAMWKAVRAEGGGSVVSGIEVRVDQRGWRSGSVVGRAQAQQRLH